MQKINKKYIKFKSFVKLALKKLIKSKLSLSYNYYFKIVILITLKKRKVVYGKKYIKRLKQSKKMLKLKEY